MAITCATLPVLTPLFTFLSQHSSTTFLPSWSWTKPKTRKRSLNHISSDDMTGESSQATVFSQKEVEVSRDGGAHLTSSFGGSSGNAEKIEHREPEPATHDQAINGLNQSPVKSEKPGDIESQR